MRSKLFAALLLALAAPLVSAADISCKVVGVSDGDTFTCLTDAKKQIKVRLAEIDTPESSQPYGSKSREMLSDLVFGKNVTLKVQDTDRYGRSVARAYVNERDVNAEMVSQGAAWVYRQYSKDRKLTLLENQAEADKRGLWALPETERVPPWEWRKAGRDQRQAQREANPALTSEVPVSSSFQCGEKRYCKEMSSCEEAKFYLQNCGPNSLDGDRDGMPCETLCR